MVPSGGLRLNDVSAPSRSVLTYLDSPRAVDENNCGDTVSKYLKVGDRVQIITPKQFIRVGYPLCSENVRDLYADEVGERVHLLRQAMHKNGSDIDHKVSSLLEQAVCFQILAEKKFGGRERQVFEIACPELLNAFGVVTKRRFVKTGTYVAGRMYGSYDECEYEPAYLENSKTHCIYHVGLDLPVDFFQQNVDVLATNCVAVPMEVFA